MDPDSRILVERLARRLRAQVVETHISWVLLAGDTAWKLKKPVRLPFVDYSTPELRRHFCAEEVRLNRRLAPGVYLGVSRVTGPGDAPAFDGDGEVLDYAVRMRRFPAGALFSEQLAAGTLEPAAVDQLAARIAAFHLQAAACAAAPGPDDGLAQRARAALAGSRPLLQQDAYAALQAWIDAEAPAAQALWSARAAGHARECHGDLHLANVLSLDGGVAAFDCIEFDAALRCIDVVEEVAFTLMDFAARGQPGLGWRFLNGWLEPTGEYEGLPGLRLCLVYRALVRAMVEHLREPRGPAALRYAGEALRWSAPARPRLVITQRDVRAIQLAKAALYAGVKLLMEKQGVDHVDMIRFAGAFGSFIDPKYAMVLGLIPDCDLADVKAVGNASGTGALMALLNRDHRREIEDAVHRIEKIETALEPHFQQIFVDAMALPNKVDAFPNLSKAVKLPPRQVDSPESIAAAAATGDAAPRRRSREERAARRNRG